MRKIIRALALSLIIASASSATSFADMTGNNGKTIPSANISIAVRHSVTGDMYKGKEKFGFMLTADDSKCPMPAGSDGRSKIVMADAGSYAEFGEIAFEYPDAYYYTVSRVEADHKGFVCPDETYKVLIVKFNDGNTHMVISNDSGEKTEEIIYTDEYTSPVTLSGSGSPKTGDESGVISRAAALAAAILSLIITVIARRKEAGNDK